MMNGENEGDEIWILIQLLEDPKEFSGTVDALFATQKHAIEAGKEGIFTWRDRWNNGGTSLGSAAGGEHLCFMGSGDNEEDKYVRMVVAYFLRQNAKYISIASGGYKSKNNYQKIG